MEDLAGFQVPAFKCIPADIRIQDFRNVTQILENMESGLAARYLYMEVYHRRPLPVLLWCKSVA